MVEQIQFFHFNGSGRQRAQQRKEIGREQKTYLDRLLDFREAKHFIDLGIRTGKANTNSAPLSYGRFTFIGVFLQRLEESGIKIGDKIKINYTIGPTCIRKDTECTIEGFKFVKANDKSNYRVLTLITDPSLGNEYHTNGIPIDQEIDRRSSLENLTINTLTNGVEVTGSFTKARTKYYLKVEKYL